MNNQCENCGKCHSLKPLKPLVEGAKVVLAGNPNVGKSVIFGALSGFYVEVSNFPGTTVDITRAQTPYGQIIDTPGAYSLQSMSEDEIVAQDIIKEADYVINVISATSLERDLFLTLQLIDLNLPLLVVINQLDEALKSGVNIDIEGLSELLGVEVITSVATENKGIEEIKKRILDNSFKISKIKTQYADKLFKNSNKDQRSWAEELLAIECVKHENNNEAEIIHKERIFRINKIINEAVVYKNLQGGFSQKLEKALYNPIFATLVAVLVLFLLFEIVGVFAAGNVVDVLYENLNTYWCPWISDIVTNIFGTNLLSEILAGEFGVLTMCISIIIGVLLPLLSAFYLFMAVLEDSGYLPRLAVFCDSFLSKIGLNGRAVIPIILGFGCATMGMMTTRILAEKKERIIATAILSIAIPCAAQQGIIISLLAQIGGFKVWAIYLSVIFCVAVLTGSILNKLIPGKSSELLISLPPLRFPRIKNALRKTLSRIVGFVKEATLFFAVGSVLISTCAYFGLLARLEKALEPLIVNILHLPAAFSDVFVMGLIRRDLASVGLFTMEGLKDLTQLQILTASVVITLFVPCIASLTVIFKERGFKEALLMWLSSFVVSITIGALIARIFTIIPL